MTLRRVLLIGDHGHGEFAAATTWLAENSLLSTAASPREAMDLLRHPAAAPELVVVAQTRPSQFSRTEIETVHRLAPLARLAVLAGSWCEGEMRTGHPWPGVQRLYWHQGVARLRELLAETSPLWFHPRTATEVERLLDLPAPRVVGQQKLIAIGAETSIAYHGLAATCVAAGFATVWIAPRHLTKVHGAAAGIWDELRTPRSLAAWHDFAGHLPDAPIVALVNFPRLADYQRLHDLGVDDVIAKPFMNADLLGVIARHVGAAPGDVHQPRSAVA